MAAAPAQVVWHQAYADEGAAGVGGTGWCLKEAQGVVYMVKVGTSPGSPNPSGGAASQAHRGTFAQAGKDTGSGQLPSQDRRLRRLV